VSGEPEPAFLFLGALPCTGWLDDTAARNPQGSILTVSGAQIHPVVRERVGADSQP
jgi:hypothetical protein